MFLILGSRKAAFFLLMGLGSVVLYPQTPAGLAVEEAETRGFLFNPRKVPFAPDFAQRLKVPNGFLISIFASGLGNPRMMAVAPDGSVYVTRPKEGDVLRLSAKVGGSTAIQRESVLKLADVHGIAIHEGMLYLADVKRIYRTALANASQASPAVFADNLPDGGQHPNRTLRVGPDNRLYVHVGSSCNACQETNPEHATLLRFRLDGSGREVFARGLRDTLGFDWDPKTGQLWGVDMGSDWRGNDVPPDELNRIQTGRDYGWPFCYGAKTVDRHTSKPPPDKSREEYCASTEGSVLDLPAHGSAINFAFYRGASFPAVMRTDAFATLRGSWNRKPASGYKVVRVRFNPLGQPVGVEDFVTGFLTDDGQSYLGRIAGLAELPDGSLLVSDDSNGVIYRIAAAK